MDTIEPTVDKDGLILESRDILTEAHETLCFLSGLYVDYPEERYLRLKIDSIINQISDALRAVDEMSDKNRR